jgi:hypothetical protein
MPDRDSESRKLRRFLSEFVWDKLGIGVCVRFVRNEWRGVKSGFAFTCVIGLACGVVGVTLGRCTTPTGKTYKPKPGHFRTLEASDSRTFGIPKGTAAVAVKATPGSHRYTLTLFLETKGVAESSVVDVYLEMLKNSNPTVEVHNATANGTLLQVISGDADNDRYLTLQFRFDGNAWRMWGLSHM